jgi:ABC-type lipoprotein release transport system permease subunit
MDTLIFIVAVIIGLLSGCLFFLVADSILKSIHEQRRKKILTTMSPPQIYAASDLVTMLEKRIDDLKNTDFVYNPHYGGITTLDTI